MRHTVEIRAGIAIVAGLLMMLAAHVVGADTTTSVGIGMGSLVVVGAGFLIAGGWQDL